MSKAFGRALGILLLGCLLSGCSASVLRFGPESTAQLDLGEEIVLVRTDGTSVRGRIAYRDTEGVVLRTRRRSVRSDPVQVDRFTERLAWSEIQSVRVQGVMDGYGWIISEQRIAGSMGSAGRRNWSINLGLLGSAAGFILGTKVYDSVGAEEASMMPFWPIWVGGTTVGGLGGYALGRILDRSWAIREIRGQRSRLADTR